MGAALGAAFRLRCHRGSEAGEGKRPNHRIQGLKADVLPFASEGGRGFGSVFRHQNSAPNCSQLGVFICVSRMTRGVPAHSACARGWSDTVPMAASSTLFCPLFSRNLCQLFRRSTRTSPCTTTSCACVDFSSSTTRLDKQTIRQTPSSGTRTASSTNPRVYGTPRALRRHGAGPRIAASLCRGASP